jgi:HlyD family secretion protein
VKTGIQDDQYIQMLEGISAEEQIITGPYEEIAKSLKNGDLVKKGEAVVTTKTS